MEQATWTGTLSSPMVGALPARRPRVSLLLRGKLTLALSGLVSPVRRVGPQPSSGAVLADVDARDSDHLGALVATLAALVDADEAGTDSLAAVVATVASLSDEDAADVDALVTADGGVLVDSDAADVDALEASAAVAAALADAGAANSDALEASAAVTAEVAESGAADLNAIGASPATEAELEDVGAPDSDTLEAWLMAALMDSDAAGTDSIAAESAVTAAVADNDAASSDSMAAAPAVAGSLADSDAASGDSLTATAAIGGSLVDSDAADTDALVAAINGALADADAADTDALGASSAVGAALADSDVANSDALAAAAAIGGSLVDSDAANADALGATQYVGAAAGPWNNAVNASNTCTVGSISTSGASFILVGIAAERTGGSTALSVASITGGGLTFTKRAGGSDDNVHDCEWWGAVSSGALSNVTLTCTMVTGDTANIGMCVESISNVKSSPVGVKLEGLTETGNLSATFAGTTAGSMLFACCFTSYDFENATAASGSTLMANLNQATQHLRSTTSRNGGSQTISSTGWTSGLTVHYSGVEILAG